MREEVVSVADMFSMGASREVAVDKRNDGDVYSLHFIGSDKLD